MLGWPSPNARSSRPKSADPRDICATSCSVWCATATCCASAPPTRTRSRPATGCSTSGTRDTSGDRKGGGAGRSGSPQLGVGGDRKGGEAGRSGSPQLGVGGDRKGGEAGRSGSPQLGVGGDRKGGEAGRSGSP